MLWRQSSLGLGRAWDRGRKSIKHKGLHSRLDAAKSVVRKSEASVAGCTGGLAPCCRPWHCFLRSPWQPEGRAMRERGIEGQGEEAKRNPHSHISDEVTEALGGGGAGSILLCSHLQLGLGHFLVPPFCPGLRVVVVVIIECSHKGPAL